MYVKSKYNLKYKCDNTLSIKELYTELGKYAESHSDNDIENIEAIRGLLFLKDGHSCFTNEEFDYFVLNSLNILCTFIYVMYLCRLHCPSFTFFFSIFLSICS